jgi:glycosyltransferase involved in cell wall biosynthesis
MNETPLRIGIDARFLTHPQTGGFKTYTQNLIAGLAALDSVHEFFLYTDRPVPNTDAYGPRFRVVVVPGTLPVVGLVWREQVSLRRQIARDRLNVFHAPCLTAPVSMNCPSVVTIHDLIWRRPVTLDKSKPSLRHLLLDWYYRHVPEQAAKRASAIITVSQAAADTIAQDLGIPQQRLRVTHEAAAERFQPVEGAAKEVRERFGLTGGFVLAMGSADPRKNVAGLMRAYAALDSALRKAYPLAIVWSSRHLADTLQDIAVSLQIVKNIRFLTDVSDEDLVFLYNSATLFVFPSRYEGFGLPLLEAMACGAPVVAADNSSIPEIAGNAALLVPTEDADEWTRTIARVLTDAALRSDLRQKGSARATQFSWTRCAQETLEVYEEAARGSG